MQEAVWKRRTFQPWDRTGPPLVGSSPVIHIVCTHKNFQGAMVLRTTRSEDIWAAQMQCWTTVYAAYLQITRVEHEAAPSGHSFPGLAEESGITLHLSGVELNKYRS